MSGPLGSPIAAEMRLSNEEIVVVDSMGNTNIKTSPVAEEEKKEAKDGEDTPASTSSEAVAAAPVKPPKVGMVELFKYSNAHERLLISLAIFMSVASGALTPAVILIMGNILGTFFLVPDIIID